MRQQSVAAALEFLKHGAGNQERERGDEQIHSRPVGGGGRAHAEPLPVGGGVGDDRGAGGDRAEHTNDKQPEGTGLQCGLVGDAGELGRIRDSVIFFFCRHGQLPDFFGRADQEQNGDQAKYQRDHGDNAVALLPGEVFEELAGEEHPDRSAEACAGEHGAGDLFTLVRVQEPLGDQAGANGVRARTRWPRRRAHRRCRSRSGCRHSGRASQSSTY